MLHAINEIKQRYKFEKNYDHIATKNENDRANDVIKLTQVQKFLLAVRDVEIIYGVSIEKSMTNNVRG